MRNQFRFLLTAVTMTLVCAAPLVADQLLGVVQEVDVAGKKIIVKPKGKDAENVTVTVTDSTIFETAKGKEIKKTTLAELGLAAVPARSRVTALVAPPPRAKGVRVEGEPAAVAAQGAEWLSKTAKVI